MAKITSNEYVKVAWVLDANMPDGTESAPSVTTLNAGTTLQLSPAIAWQDFALGATDSDDVEDRGITDPGNAVTRGFSNFEATLAFFRDADPNDLTSDYVKAWEAFKVPRTYGYLVIRVAEKHWSAPWTAGDRVSVFRFVADIIVDDTEGDDSVKFTVNFLPQGQMFTYTQVAAAPKAALTAPATLALAVGEAKALAVTLSGVGARANSTYVSSDTTKATVSRNGVVKGMAAGTTTVTATHPGALAPSTTTVTVA